jgi:hypothetical protein
VEAHSSIDGRWVRTSMKRYFIKENKRIGPGICNEASRFVVAFTRLECQRN